MQTLNNKDKAGEICCRKGSLGSVKVAAKEQLKQLTSEKGNEVIEVFEETMLPAHS